MNNDPIKLYRIQNDFAFSVLKYSWHLVKKNYALAIALVFSLIIFGAILSFLPPILTVIVGILQTLLWCSILVITKKWIEGATSKYSDLFYIIRSPELLRLMAPMLVVNFLLSSPTIYFQFFPLKIDQMTPLYLVTLLTFSISIFFFGYSVPQIIFQRKSLGSTILPNIHALLKNWLPLLIMFLIGSVFILISTLLFILPLFFVAFPILITAPYIVYAAIFEGFEIPKDNPTATMPTPPLIGPQ